MALVNKKERKKVEIPSSRLAKNLAFIEQNTPINNMDFLKGRIEECKSMLETLLKTHTDQSNCCPDITRRLKLTISYIGDVEIKCN